MGFFDWKDQYSVGIKVMDQQHKRLVALVNELFEAMQKGSGRQGAARVLKGVLDYTNIHFQTEEQLMKSNSYPGFLAHKREHQDLTERSLELLRASEEGHLTVPLETGKFLKEWLSTHILGSDKLLGSYLKKKGAV